MIKIKGDTVEITETKTIDLKPIKQRLLLIEQQLSTFPSPKTKPDQETLDFWNYHNVVDNMEKSHILEEKRILEEGLSKFEVKDG